MATPKEKHGYCGTPIYRAWDNMRTRCLNPNGPEFHNYGGRGIKVCPRWRDSFLAFLEDVGERPSPQHTLDRVDTNGDYEPSNVRWATRKEQARNQRKNRPLTFQGKTQPLAAWAEELGFKPNTLHRRIVTKGIPDSVALSSPLVRGLRTGQKQKTPPRRKAQAITEPVANQDR